MDQDKIKNLKAFIQAEKDLGNKLEDSFLEPLTQDIETFKLLAGLIDSLDWQHVSQYYRLSEEFIKTFSDKVEWDYISRNQKLSENFIREYQDRFCWKCISKYQKLSEEFIVEFEDKIYWNIAFAHQKLSITFRNKWKHRNV